MHEAIRHVKTADGDMPVEVFTPTQTGACPGIIFFMDIFGFRDELRDMCRRYAAAGYAVFLPGLFYRQGNPCFQPTSQPGDGAPAEASALNEALTTEMTAEDTANLIQQVAKLTEVLVPAFGTVGYCMGGRHAMASAARNKGDVRAAASLHGGRLINATPHSMEKLIDDMEAELFFGFAKDDPTCPPDHQSIIEQALAVSSTPGRIEYFDAAHGWTFPERYCFDKPAAERAWTCVLDLFGRRLQQRANAGAVQRMPPVEAV